MRWDGLDERWVRDLNELTSLLTCLPKPPDLLVFETFYTLPNIHAAFTAASQTLLTTTNIEPEKPKKIPKVVLSLTVTREGFLPVPNDLDGSLWTPTQVFEKLFESVGGGKKPAEWIQAVGVNCSFGLEGLEQVLGGLVPFCRKWGMGVWCVPSKGLPGLEKEGWAREFVDILERVLQDDALVEVWVGGCCGTCPRDIADLKSELEKVGWI
ncbi:hypothetical protein HDV05_008140 [Chytridiales sp. JEL 0842]|nr:hypothetical protein HDV05_008140 [Chytridiales sp. JEL 0842]